MFYGGSQSVVASRAKCLLILAVVGWALCATTWLVALSVQEHCPMARTTRVITKLDMNSPLEPALNVTTSTLSSVSVTHSSKENILQYYSSLVYGGGGGGGCTMVMLTYKRVGLLPRILKHYCKVASLQRILVVWNDVGTSVPQALLNLTKECRVNIKFILSEENKLTNRYLPRSEIETECKLREHQQVFEQSSIGTTDHLPNVV